MEVSAANLQLLSTYLQKTLSSDHAERRSAEKYLESVEANLNYPVLLLQLIAADTTDVHIRISAGITFKNYVKRNWRVLEDIGNRIHDTDRQTIKQTIVPLMLKSPEQVQKQLGEAVSIIGREDFPDKWPDLIQEMVGRFHSGDFYIINGVLRTAHSLFKRYRHEFKSEGLWKEIKFVLENFAEPITRLFSATLDLVKSTKHDEATLKVLFSSLLFISKIFYSLNFQDLPEFFEDNMSTWMAGFHALMVTDQKLLESDSDDEPGILDELRSQICDIVTMYAQKYDEEFAAHLPGFVTAIWNLLLSTGSQVKYDLLVSNAIQFLASVAERPTYSGLFADPNTLASICERVIVPNMSFRDVDEEMFEDNAEEYIRRDIEGSDIDTRRRAACDLVRALCKSFEGPVIQNFSAYIQAMLQEYARNPSENWRNKDVAIFLVTSLAAKAQTQKHGTTQTSELINVTDFFHGHIAPDLQDSDVNKLPVLKADSLKYVMVFRSQLSRDILLNVIPHSIRLLGSGSHVVNTYAAASLEKIFTIKATGGASLITKDDLKPHVEFLLNGLLHALNHEANEENDYVMKAIMRSLSVLQEDIVPYIGNIITELTKRLILVSKNPSKPHFNHFLFESLCIAIRMTCRVQPEAVVSFEQGLFPTFQEILQQDVQEFIPYVFQVLSLLLELHTDSVPEAYLLLFPHLLQPILWERPGNIPPLVRLLQAFIEKGAAQIQPDKLTGLLGVFQKLIASKTNDHQGFYLLQSLIQYMPQATLGTYMKQVFLLLFQRLQSSKTTKYVKSLLVFFSLYALRYTAQSLHDIVESIQPKMFLMVIEKLFIVDLQKVSGTVERKICAVGVTNVLCQLPFLYSQYSKLWMSLLQSLIGLFELPEDDTVPEDEHFVDIEDAPGYQTAYSQLVFASKKDNDPCSHIANPKSYLATSLHQMSSTQQIKLGGAIAASLQSEAVVFLKNYCSQAGVELA